MLVPQVLVLVFAETPSLHTNCFALNAKLKQFLVDPQSTEQTFALLKLCCVARRSGDAIVKPAAGPWYSPRKHANGVTVDVPVTVMAVGVDVVELVLVLVTDVELAVVEVATEFEDWVKYISGCNQAKKHCLLYL